MEDFIYNILTYIVVGVAIIIAGLRFYKTLNPVQKTSCESGCGGCTSKCDLKEAFQKQS